MDPLEMRKVRNGLNITRLEYAKMAGISVAIIKAMEAGNRKMSDKTFRKVSAVHERLNAAAIAEGVESLDELFSIAERVLKAAQE